MSGFDFAARAMAGEFRSALPGLFTELNVRSIPETVCRVDSIGHGAAGRGAGSYVADELCTADLLASHPRFAFRCQTGRIFRLLPEGGALSVEQGGAVGQAGTDDRPAIQAAIDYAEAVGASEVCFGGEYYELWAPLRTSPLSHVYAEDGHLLVVRKSLTLSGAAGTRTTFDCKGVVGSDPESNWQLVATSDEEAALSVWRGGGLFVLGDRAGEELDGLNVDRIELHRLVFKGNRKRTEANGTWPADPQTGDGWDISDKGFWLQDCHVGEIHLVDTDFIGWKGELFYLSPISARSLHLERCRLLTTNGNALNPGGVMPMTVRDCEFGDAYLAWEDSGKKRAYLSNCLFRDSNLVFCGGGNASGSASLATYAYSQRDESTQPPIMQLEGCEFRNIPSVLIGSWIRGRVRTTDSMIDLRGPVFGALRDVDLEVEAWLDQFDGLQPLVLSGPENETTQIAGAALGLYVQPPRNVHAKIRCRRTELAAHDGKHWHNVGWSGLIDPSCSLHLETAEIAIDKPPFSSNNPPLSFPHIRLGQLTNTQGWGAPASLWLGAIVSDTVISPRGPVCATAVETEDIFNISLASAPAMGSTYGYAEGQRFLLYKRNDIGGLRFVKSASPVVQLSQTRLLDRDQDWIEFRWNPWVMRWEECGFFTSA